MLSFEERSVIHTQPLEKKQLVDGEGKTLFLALR